MSMSSDETHKFVGLLYEVDSNLPSHYKWLVRSCGPGEAGKYLANIYEENGYFVEQRTYPAWGKTPFDALDASYKMFKANRAGAH